MSHTLRKANLGNSALVDCVINDYVQGGESFTLAELGLTGGIAAVFFIPVLGSDPSLFLVLTGGKLVLKSTFPTFSEIPSTPGVNYPFVAIVHGT